MLSHAKTVILFAIGIFFNGQTVSQRQWIGALATFIGVVWYLVLLESSSPAPGLRQMPSPHLRSKSTKKQ
jgi:drug/metabolite transporter (DMT)-like permease